MEERLANDLRETEALEGVEAAGSLWERSADRVFAVGPVIHFPIEAAAARYSYFVVGILADTGKVYLEQIWGTDGLDLDQMRTRLIVGIKARGKCVIRRFKDEVDFCNFCETTWPGREEADEEAEIALAKKFPNLRKQIGAFVLDRAKEALASSRGMNSNWYKMLETTCDHFASDMSRLDASTTTNQAKVRALGPINDAFSVGVLVGNSMSDEEVAQMWAAMKSGRSSIAGKKSGEVRRANRPWVSHATELAVHACDSNPRASDETIAGLIADNWKFGHISAPGHRTLSGFVAELRKGHKLPQRTGSLQKGTC